MEITSFKDHPMSGLDLVMLVGVFAFAAVAIALIRSNNQGR